MEMEYKAAPLEIKADTQVEGRFEGHFAIFNNVDDGGDIVHPGAFTKTIQERRGRIQQFYLHDWNKLTGPPPEVVEEDATGLRVAGRVTVAAIWGHEVWALMQDNALKEGSFGYETIKSDQGELNGHTVRNLREVKLYEISFVPLGMNALTTVRAVKAALANGWTATEFYSAQAAAFLEALRAGRASGDPGLLIRAQQALLPLLERKFSGSPRNPFGTHSSYKFKGGQAGYKAAWHCHFARIRDTGPIQGTVRRCAMIAAAMKPACDLPGTDSIDAVSKPPDDCAFPERPSDYGLARWQEPADDEDRAGMQLSCADLAIIKRAALGEIKRRAAEREAEEGGKGRWGADQAPPCGEEDEDSLAEDSARAVLAPAEALAAILLELKEGRVLSGASKEKVTTALDAMRGAIGALEDLLAAAEPDKSHSALLLTQRLRAAELALALGYHS